MALSFKNNMFFCWSKNKTTKCLIGFTSIDGKRIFDVRDRLSKCLYNNKNLVMLKIEGEPTKRDSILRLVDKKDEKIVHSLLKKKTPGIFATVFKTKNYRDWQKEQHSIMQLVKVSIETSHDFSGLIIDSNIHSPEGLSIEIKKVFYELSLELYENAELEKVNIFENRTLG
ncbi:MAG: hypothetical protein OEV55_02175 [candidate division Zixibacteria bacterium]|nr:hypothetical protein [candidate division Zixibacteria bacterium]